MRDAVAAWLRDVRGVDLRESGRKIASVYTDLRYVAVFLAGTGLAYAFYALLVNYRIVGSVLASGDPGLAARLIWGLIAGYPMSTSTVSLALTVVIAAGVGLNLSLVVFRLVQQAGVGRADASTVGGMAVAVIAPACPACATALFASAGLTSVFALLPFQGTEIKVLAVLLLAGSALWITTQIDRTACEFC